MSNIKQRKSGSDRITVKRITRTTKISKTQKAKFTRQMAGRIWGDSSFLEKELTKYENIKVIYD